MKKIIELAEKVCNARFPFVTSDLCELDRAIGEHKELEQTPITEEWLKEQKDELLKYKVDDYADKGRE